MCELIAERHGMGMGLEVDGRGVAMLVQHKAERAPEVNGWDLALVIDCPEEQHKRLQEPGAGCA
jgi:hypothetical protein